MPLGRPFVKLRGDLRTGKGGGKALEAEFAPSGESWYT